MEWSDITEPVTEITLPGKLPNGDVLIGAGPKVKQMGFVSINVSATYSSALHEYMYI